MSGEYPEVCIRPSLDDWNVLVSQHEDATRRDAEDTHTRLVRSFQERARSRLTNEARGGTLDPGQVLDLSQQIPWAGEVTDGIAEDDAKRAMIRDFVAQPYCPTDFIWPPFPWCSPDAPAIIRPGPTKYARSLAHAHNNGRIEIGVAAVPYESVAVVGDLRMSTASASVTTAKAISPVLKPTTVTVYADALVNALFAYASAGPKSLLAGINVDLVLTITTFKGGIQVARDRKTIYSTHGQILFAYVDKLSAKGFSLSASTELFGADYLIASLSVEATAIAEQEQENSAVAAIADIEGYKQSPGEFPYHGGSVFVPGFMIQTCHKS